MLAGHFHAPRQIKLIEIDDPPDKDDPSLASGQILFRPELACICGSDLTYFEGDYPEFAPEIGQSLHEMIGVVVETTGERFRPGDRVLCVPLEHFGLQQRYWVSEDRAIPVDPRVSDEQAVLAQPLGTVLYAMRKLPNILGWNVAVVGQGPIGQLFCGVLRNLGARQIIAIDLLEERLESSKRFGATAAVAAQREDPIEAVRQLTGGVMADLVVEAVGHREQVLNLCVDLSRQDGTILQFGVPPETIDGVRIKDLFWKNLKVVTSVGPEFTRDFPLAMQWIAEGRLDVSPLVTHTFPLGEIQKAFNFYSQRLDKALKVFVDFR